MSTVWVVALRASLWLGLHCQAHALAARPCQPGRWLCRCLVAALPHRARPWKALKARSWVLQRRRDSKQQEAGAGARLWDSPGSCSMRGRQSRRGGQRGLAGRMLPLWPRPPARASAPAAPAGGPARSEPRAWGGVMKGGGSRPGYKPRQRSAAQRTALPFVGPASLSPKKEQASAPMPKGQNPQNRADDKRHAHADKSI